MDEKTLLERITCDPKIFGGKPIIRGRRLTASCFSHRAWYPGSHCAGGNAARQLRARAEPARSTVG